MDFFANAFVTRDVVDPKNMVVKDGIQIREKALASESGSTLAPPPIPGTSSSASSSSGNTSGLSTSPDVVNCEVCGTVAAKYKCPGCFCQTCSLACSKQHKLDTTCSGVRSRTHFVERKQYTEQDMMSDYNFLEEVGRTVDNAARENIKLEAGSGSHSGRKKVFGPNGVVTVSGGNNRRERNNNRNKNQGHQDGGDEEEDKSVAGLAQKAAQDLEKLGAEGSGSYKDKQLIMQAKKRGTHLIMMADGLKKRKENHTNWKDKLNKLNWTIEWLFPEMDSTRRILEHKNDDSLTLTTLLIGALSKDENKDIAAKYPIDTLDQCRLYFVIPLRHANQPALYPLATAASLQEALKFKKVLEYPTILVLGPNNSASSNVTQTVPPTSEQQDPTTSTLTVAETDLNAEKGEPTLVTETATEETEGTTASDTKVLVTDKDKSINTTTTTVTVVYPVPTDHTHPLLEKYTIEEPPSQWPKRPTPTNNSNNQNNKRQNDTPAVTASNKKSKVDSEGKEDVEMSASSDDSSDDDSDSDDSSSDDDSSDDSSDSSDNDKDEKEDAAVATNEIADEQEDDTTEQEDVDLKIGQAILEAFNQDFGGAAE